MLLVYDAEKDNLKCIQKDWYKQTHSYLWYNSSDTKTFLVE